MSIVVYIVLGIALRMVLSGGLVHWLRLSFPSSLSSRRVYVLQESFVIHIRSQATVSDIAPISAACEVAEEKKDRLKSVIDCI